MHGLCVRCAKAGGGLVFPPLFYGENREEALLEANHPKRAEIATELGLPPANFDPGYMQRPAVDQSSAYHQLLLHILREIRSLGFQVIAIGAGHYPLLDHARAAAAIFHQEQSRLGAKAITWVFSGYELVRELIPEAGDHAGKWETSLMMAVDAATVDLSELPDREAGPPLGAGPNCYDATAEFGEMGIRAVVEKVTEQVRLRLEHRERYVNHGLRS
jgi:creatinine amidohydrolase/Fe(II)-dependent formamide hydrolase-like protein